jgi:hypothetical protein
LLSIQGQWLVFYEFQVGNGKRVARFVPYFTVF